MEKVKAYLLENADQLNSLVSEINSYDGSLEHLEAYENDDEFFNTYFSGKPMEAVRAAQFGEYNYHDDYVKFDGYGNLVSYSNYEYQNELEENIDDIVERVVELQQHLYLDSELQEILEGEEE